MGDITKEAIAHWRMLARKERERLTWDKSYLPQLAEAKAETYQNAALSLELGDKTGVAHCACHLIPLTECAERVTRRRAR